MKTTAPAYAAAKGLHGHHATVTLHSGHRVAGTLLSTSRRSVWVVTDGGEDAIVVWNDVASIAA
jgi:hypothetical protein